MKTASTSGEDSLDRIRGALEALVKTPVAFTCMNTRLILRTGVNLKTFTLVQNYDAETVAKVREALADMGVLPKLVKGACDGKLTARCYAQLWRERRNFGPYLRWILRACTEAGRPKREAMVCRSVTTRMRAPGFRKYLERLENSGLLGRK